MYLYLLFLVRSCAHPIFRHEIVNHSFLFCCFLLLNLIDFFYFFTLCLNIFLTTPSFLPHQISSIKFDLLLCVHRHAHFICKFTSQCSMFDCLFVYLISNFCFFNTAENVTKGVGWLDVRQGPSAILCARVPLVFTLISYFVIVFSFILISTDIWCP